MFILQTNIIVIGKWFRRFIQTWGEWNYYSDCDSSESWNRNHFWFMLVESESESFGIVRSGIVNSDGVHMIPIPHIYVHCSSLRLIQE